MLTALYSACLVALPLACAPSATELQPVATRPGVPVSVAVTATSGTGCRPGSTTVAMSPDNSAFTVAYSDFTALAGAGATLSQRNRSCQLSLRVGGVGGYRFAVARTDHRGFANLADGVALTQSAKYWFQGALLPRLRVHQLRGPIEDNWQFTDTVLGALLQLGPCSSTTTLVVDTALTVSGVRSGSAATSWAAMDSTDGSLTSRYQLTWQRC